MVWRILVRDGIAEEGVEIFRREAEVVEGDLSEHLGMVEAIVVRNRTKVTSEVIRAALPRLHVIGRAGVGVDNIDLEAARDHGIIVVNAPRSTSIAVAEHTLALMLALARHIPLGNSSMHRGEWRKKELRGLELMDKTLGIIGAGRIGSEVAKRVLVFGMHVMAFDPFLSEERIRQIGAQPVKFAFLLRNSDFITLHLPLNDDTRDLISTDELAMMKPGAYLLNTSRGGIIDEKALLAALNQEALAGAALDVFAEEPPGPTPLVLHPKVICTPHLGAQTSEAQVRAAIDIAREVLAALKDEALHWRIV